jgi:L-iditol 2-dehydrogenase
MKAIAKTKREPGIEVIDAPEEVFTDDQVLLKMRSASICGSDLGFYDFLPSYQRFAKIPVIMGHEFAGEIARIGKNVSGFTEGERVSCESVLYCGKCKYCRSGMTNICQNFTVFGMQRNGGFAEYVAVDPKFLHKIPSGVSFLQAGVIEPLSVVVNALDDVGNSRLGQFAAIIGPGPLGLLSAEVLKARGISRQLVIGVSVDSIRLEIARNKLGLDAINSDETNPADAQKSMTEGYGFDIVVVAAGAPAALKSASTLVAKGGQIIIIGIPHEEVPIQAADLVRKQVSMKGSYGSSWKHYEIAISLLLEGKTRVEEIVTHRFHLEEADEAFETARSKAGCKVQFQN